jgi:DNA polymerase-1
LKELETNLDTMKLELIGELEKIAGPGLKLQQGLFGNSDIERKLNSPKEMVSFITHHLGIPVVNTSAETIAEHLDKHPFFPLFAKYKVVHTLLSNFVSPYWDWIKPDGRVHPHFRIQRSGRIAAIEPHLSNQAKENEKLPDVNIRSLLTAGEGNSLLRIDYSGQEMRIDAHLTGDESMIRAFRDDIDVHLFVANRVNKLGIPEEYLVETHPKYKEIREKYAAERTKFKAINFGLIYGKTVAGFAREWKVEYMEAAKVVGDFFQEFPKIREAMDYWKKFQARTGYTVNCVGRRRRYNRPMDDGSYRSGFNHLHQSLGADMMKKAAGECWRYIHQKNLPIDIVLTIHDELMFEGPETLLRREEPNFCQIMTSTMKLNVPIKVESKIVKTYGD